MAVYRVERTRDYTVMCNYHLKDKALSLKAKGLLSMMLSMPEEWNYSTRGLAAICKEGVEAVGNALKELEKAGYMVRRQLRGYVQGKGLDNLDEYIVPVSLGDNQGVMGAIKLAMDAYMERGGRL